MLVPSVERRGSFFERRRSHMTAFRMTNMTPEEVALIAQCYVETFAGAPWFETWEHDHVVKDFTNEMQRPSATCFAAIEHGSVIGFTWGYWIESGSELDDHVDAPGLHEHCVGEFFYLDECGVSPQHQARGVGTRLIRELFRHQPYGNVLLRTKRGSPMQHMIEKMGGLVIQSISDDRIIMRLSL